MSQYCGLSIALFSLLQADPTKKWTAQQLAEECFPGTETTLSVGIALAALRKKGAATMERCRATARWWLDPAVIGKSLYYDHRRKKLVWGASGDAAPCRIASHRMRLADASPKSPIDTEHAAWLVEVQRVREQRLQRIAAQSSFTSAGAA